MKLSGQITRIRNENGCSAFWPPSCDWNNDNTANADKGVYDASKWAVVFRYISVTVATGATVTFKNHASRAPVVWLVGGNVTINGTVKLDGEKSGNGALPAHPILAEPGPGGFRGASHYFSDSAQQGSGFGIGGGLRHPHHVLC